MRLHLPNNVKPKKILCVVGTRPEAIKMAPVVRALKNNTKEFKTEVVATAQHREMLDDVLRIFSIQAKHDLHVMQAGQTLFQVTTKVLERMEEALQLEKPDMVLVHGDTTTTLAACLASFYLRIPVGHVEAGLRSHDYDNPFPEEANRRLADSLCTLHFAPTLSAKKNLLQEHINPKGIFVTGNTAIDALHMAISLSKARRSGSVGLYARQQQYAHKGLHYHTPRNYNGCKDAITPLILITAHRRENFGQPIRNVCQALKHLALKHPDFEWVYPVHPNPNITKPVKEILSGIPNFHLLEPLSYIEFVGIMNRAYLIITDSGGLQEEAPSLGKPVLVLRKVTERPEAVTAGTVKIIGAGTNDIIRHTEELIKNKRSYSKMARAVNPYGDGKASQRTIEAIRHFFGFRRLRPAEFK